MSGLGAFAGAVFSNAECFVGDAFLDVLDLCGEGLSDVLPLVGEIPPDTEDFAGEVRSRVAAFVGEIRPGLAGKGGGASILVFVGDVGFILAEGCILFAGREGRRGVKSSGDCDCDCDCWCCRTGVCRGAGIFATLVWAEPYA